LPTNMKADFIMSWDITGKHYVQRSFIKVKLSCKLSITWAWVIYLRPPKSWWTRLRTQAFPFECSWTRIGQVCLHLGGKETNLAQAGDHCCCNNLLGRHKNSIELEHVDVVRSVG
jgi:hypothetical protein